MIATPAINIRNGEGMHFSSSARINS